MFAASILVLVLAQSPAKPKPLPVSAHNCYAGADTSKLKQALGLGIDNIEIDLGWDAANGRLIVGHDEKPVPGASYPTFEEYVRPVFDAPKRSDGAPRILTLDWKTSKPEAVAKVKAFIEAHAYALSFAEKSADGKFHERRLTVCFTGSDVAKDHYDRMIPPGGRYLAFRDKVFGGSDYKTDPKAYAASPATPYLRFLTFHWGVIERGGPPRAGDWTADEAERLKTLVEHAHEQGYRLRFYCLNGGGSVLSLPYRFTDMPAAKIRWKAAAKAGVDWVASDNYAEIAEELR